MKSLSFYLSEKLARKIEELSKEKGVSKSQLVSDLLELGLQKQQAFDIAQDTKLDKLKLELETKLNNLKDDFNSKLNQAKNELSLDFSYKIEKLQDQLGEIQSKLNELDKLSIILDETLFHAVYTQKLVANHIYLTKVMTDEKIMKVKELAQEAISEFKKALKGGKA